MVCAILPMNGSKPMSDPIQAIDFHAAVTAEYRSAVKRHADTREGIHRQDAFAFANEAIRARISSGEIEVPVDDLIHSALLAADKREGDAGDRLVQELAEGVIGLNLWPDPRLDSIIVLGAGVRKPFRHVTAEDLNVMAALRHGNANAAIRAHRKFAKHVQSILPDLATARTVGALVESAQARVSA